MPDVTVLMPVFNAERHLRPAIDSILAQTYHDFELIVIDDGSTDRSAEITASYRDPRVRLLGNERNLGLSASLNRGLAAAKSDLIARQDSDDLSAPRRLEIQVAAMAARPELALIGTQAWAIDEEGRRLKPVARSVDPVSIRWYGLFDNPFIHSSVIFRRDIVRDLGGYDATFDPESQDYALWSAIMRHHAVMNLSDPLITYRVHSSSIFGAHAGNLEPSSRSRYAGMVRTLVGDNIRMMFGEALVDAAAAATMADFVLGLDGRSVDRFLTVFFRLLRLFQDREPEWRASADFRLTLARQVDAIAYRVSPASRRTALRVYSAALRHDPALWTHLSWPRAVALAILGKRARTGLASLRRYDGRVDDEPVATHASRD